MVIYQPDLDLLRVALLSILQQSFQRFEVVIVEDPSERMGREVVESLGDSRLRYFGNTNRTSLIAQRNRALAESQAEFVAIMDGDDIAEPSRLAQQYRFLQEHPNVAVVGSQIQVIDHVGNPIGFRQFPLDHDTIVQAMRRIVPLNQPSVMVRKSAVHEVGGYQCTTAGLAEDYHLWSRLARQGARFANLSEALLRYRIHPRQIKCRNTHATIRAVLEVKKQYWTDTMDLGARARMWGEWSLLWLPEPLVLRLLLWNHYARVPFVRSRDASLKRTSLGQS